jgi:hypothetical protein
MGGRLTGLDSEQKLGSTWQRVGPSDRRGRRPPEVAMFGTSWRVARIAGIEVRVDNSWTVIALLIT